MIAKICVASCAFVLMDLYAAPYARAQISPWPDSQSCATSSSTGVSGCLTVTQTTTTNGGLNFAMVAKGGNGGGGGLYAESQTGNGIQSNANGSTGVAILGNAVNSSNPAVEGIGGSSNVGVWGSSAALLGSGVYGVNGDGAGVWGHATSTGIGVYGDSGGGFGVEGLVPSNGGYPYAGVYGVNDNTSGGWGVRGDAVGPGSGVYGHATGSTGNGVYGDAPGGGYAGFFNGKTNTTGCIQYNGTNEFGCTSDRRLKKDISPLTNGLEALLRLRGVTYDWKKPEDQDKHAKERQTGFIAQEVEEVFPSWVDENAEGYKTLAIQPAHIAALEVEAIRTLKVENDSLRARSAVLEDRVRSLEAGRRPLVSGMGEGGIGVGLCALAGAIAFARRRRAEDGC